MNYVINYMTIDHTQIRGVFTSESEMLQYLQKTKKERDQMNIQVSIEVWINETFLGFYEFPS